MTDLMTKLKKRFGADDCASLDDLYMMRYMNKRQKFLVKIYLKMWEFVNALAHFPFETAAIVVINREVEEDTYQRGYELGYESRWNTAKKGEKQ